MRRNNTRQPNLSALHQAAIDIYISIHHTENRVVQLEQQIRAATDIFESLPVESVDCEAKGMEVIALADQLADEYHRWNERYGPIVSRGDPASVLWEAGVRGFRDEEEMRAWIRQVSQTFSRKAREWRVFGDNVRKELEDIRRWKAGL